MSKRQDQAYTSVFGVNFDIVWRIIKQELPGLARQIEKIPLGGNKSNPKKDTNK